VDNSGPGEVIGSPACQTRDATVWNVADKRPMALVPSARYIPVSAAMCISLAAPPRRVRIDDAGSTPGGNPCR